MICIRIREPRAGARTAGDPEQVPEISGHRRQDPQQQPQAAGSSAEDQPGRQLDPSADDLHQDPGAAAAAERVNEQGNGRRPQAAGTGRIRANLNTGSEYNIKR